jgi:hypothetical protein
MNIINSCIQALFGPPIWVHEGELKYKRIKPQAGDKACSPASRAELFRARHFQLASAWFCCHLNRCFHLLGGELARIEKEKKGARKREEKERNKKRKEEEKKEQVKERGDAIIQKREERTIHEPPGSRQCPERGIL